MYGELGEGTISMVVGYLMGWIRPQALFYAMLVCGMGLGYALWRVFRVMEC